MNPSEENFDPDARQKIQSYLLVGLSPLLDKDECGFAYVDPEVRRLGDQSLMWAP